MASAAGRSRCAACHGGMGLFQGTLTSECAHTFHLRCVAGAAAWPVCGAAFATPVPGPTSFFFPSKPESDLKSLFQQQPPATSTSPFSFGVSPTQPEPARTSLFGQQPPATANPFSSYSSFSPTPPEAARTSLFREHPATASPFFPVQPHWPFGPVRTDTVRAVKSSRYESRVVAYGRAASVDVGELYADEERRFLLFVDVPRAGAADGDATRLVRVSCTYRDTATGQSMDMEVQLERFRVEATEDIAAAQAAAERGDHAEAARILDRRQEDLHPRGGPAGVRAHGGGMSSHAQQRASSVQFFGNTAATPVFSGSSVPGLFPTSTGGSASGRPSWWTSCGELNARFADRREYEHTGAA